MRTFLGICLSCLLLLTPFGNGWIWFQSEAIAPSLMTTLIVLVEFEDRSFPMNFQISSITRLLNQMAAYFAEVSGNRSSFMWHLHDRIVRLNKPISFYGSDREAPGDDKGGNPRGLLALIMDTVAKVDPEIDFTRFRFLMIAHAGPDQASIAQDKLSTEIWSQTLFKIQPGIVTRPEGAVIDGASIVSHSDPLGVWAHEFAHLVGRLPDMYVRAKGGSLHLVGPWSLMDLGAQLGEGKVPSHLDAWSKWVLGWLDFNTIVLSRPVTLILEAVNGSPRPVALRIPLTNGSFYVVEARIKRGFDSLLPAEGVLIYLVTPSRITSETTVRLIDIRPDTKTLDDAVLSTQKVFEDKQNRVVIQILSRDRNRFTLRIGTELNIQLRVKVPQTVYTLQPASVIFTIQPLISGLTYELYVDGVLYDQGEMIQPSLIQDLYFTPWRIGKHNITLVINDARDSILFREVKEIVVSLHPIIQLSFPLLIVVAIIYVLIKRTIHREKSQAAKA